MRKKRKSFSLITKAVQKDMHESDIVITGYISKELFLLIENLNSFTQSEFVEVSRESLKNTVALTLSNIEFKELMKDLCDVSITINMLNQKKTGSFSIINDVALSEDKCRLKLNESFMFLMHTEIFNCLSSAIA
jgi:hypothetical protein